MISPHESFDYTAASTGERGGGKVGGGKWEGGGGGEGLNSNTFFFKLSPAEKTIQYFHRNVTLGCQSDD